MDQFKKQLNFWKTSSKRNLETAEILLKLKRYDSCLFFCHLSIEKLLKCLVMHNTNKIAPYIHDLERLAIIADLQLSDEQIEQLKIITMFNISARYESIKFSFYEKCTKAYTEKHFIISKNLYLWLEKQYPIK